jgi:hypothetical protein
MRFLVAVVLLTTAASAHAQFLEQFDAPRFAVDPSGIDGWAFFSGDGTVAMDFRAVGNGHATISVDATEDHRNVWWALIKHKVSDGMDLDLLARPGFELRVEARIRVSHAPRRVNLHVNTQRTTDFHSHLMEFDIPDTENWHTISMTTGDFPAGPGDTVFAQLALMDWGLDRYRVDIDYFKVDVVDVTRAGPDHGDQVPYHPPIPDPSSFRHHVQATEGATIDLANPEFNLRGWSAQDHEERTRVVTVSGTLWVILRFDLEPFAGKHVADHGLLELTTHSVVQTTEDLKDFGAMRVAEILGGDPAWERETVTAANLWQGAPIDRVVNPQMIIDWPVAEGRGSVTRFVISKPVLQRMIDGRTLGLAIRPQGSISASFIAVDGDGRPGARLLFNVVE